MGFSRRTKRPNGLTGSGTSLQDADPKPGPGALLPEATQRQGAPAARPLRLRAAAGPGTQQRRPPSPRLPATRDLVSLIVKGQLFIFIVQGSFFPSGISRRRLESWEGAGGTRLPTGAHSRPAARCGRGNGEEE